MFETNFLFSGFDGYKQTTNITNVIDCLDLNVIKVGIGFHILDNHNKKNTTGCKVQTPNE